MNITEVMEEMKDLLWANDMLYMLSDETKEFLKEYFDEDS